MEGESLDPKDFNKLAVNLFNGFASRYEEKYMGVDQYARSFIRFCDYLSEKATVLELACGPGNITRFLLDHRPDLNFLATDLSPAMLELAQKNNPTAIVQSLDCRDIPSLARKFEGIVAGFVLPYLSENEVEAMMKAISTHIKPDGAIYLSWMQGPASHSGWQNAGEDQLYMYYHPMEKVKELANHCGLQTSDEFEFPIPNAHPDIRDAVLILQPGN